MEIRIDEVYLKLREQGLILDGTDACVNCGNIESPLCEDCLFCYIDVGQGYPVEFKEYNLSDSCQVCFPSEYKETRENVKKQIGLMREQLMKKYLKMLQDEVPLLDIKLGTYYFDENEIKG